MADEEQVKLLQGGVEAWNRWREENLEAEIDLRGAELGNAHLRGVNLSGANLSGARLGDAELVYANLSQASLNHANLIRADLDQANLTRADLRQAVLRYANLPMADLTSAKLSEADLISANLSGVFAQGVDLNGAYLGFADLIEADLRGARLIAANLIGADFNQADLRGANLHQANLSKADLSRADLTEADLSGTFLLGTSLLGTILGGATLSGAHVWGISVWDVKGEPAAENGLIITPVSAAAAWGAPVQEKPPIQVDDLEVAQFIYLLLNGKKLRNVLDSVTQKGVLILGRFDDGGLEVLQAITERVRGLGYLPMLFDFEPTESLDFTETVQTMVGLARFVIVDVSGPSVLKELEATVKNFEKPFVPILEEGLKSPSMTGDLTKYPWFWWGGFRGEEDTGPIRFSSQDDLLDMLPGAVIAPAEEIRKQIEKRRAKLLLDQASEGGD